MAFASKTFSSYNYVGKDGRYLSLKIEETAQNPSNNSSTIKWTLTTNGGAVPYYDTYCYISINGKNVFFSNGRFSAAGYNGWIGSANHPVDTEAWVDVPGNTYNCAKWGFSTSGTLPNSVYPDPVYHNNDGTKNLNVVFLVGIFYYTVSNCGGTVTLGKIDRTVPKVTQNDVKTNANIFNQVTISAKSDITCNPWWYQMKEGSGAWGNWVKINSSGTNKSATISGLSANTTYSFRWCGRNASNGLDGYSNIKSVKILGASQLKKVNDIYLDVTNPKLSINLVAYSTSFYNLLVLSKGNKAILFKIGWSQTGGATMVFDLSKYEVTPVESLNNVFTAAEYAYMATFVGKDGTISDGKQSVQNLLLNEWIGPTNLVCENVTASLYTYENSSYSNKIENDPSEITGVQLKLREANVKPTLTVDGYEVYIDPVVINGVTYNQYIQPNSSSRVRLLNIIRTVKYGATISSLSVTLQATTSSKTSIITNSIIDNNYNCQWEIPKDAKKFIITLKDSRNFSVSVDVYLQIYTPGALIKQADYDGWYQTLKNHFNVKDYTGKYIISGESNSNGLTSKEKTAGKIVLAEDMFNIRTDINKILSTINSGSTYYNSVQSELINIIDTIDDTITEPVSSEIQKQLIQAKTKSDINTNLTQINNIVIFNLKKG